MDTYIDARLTITDPAAAIAAIDRAGWIDDHDPDPAVDLHSALEAAFSPDDSTFGTFADGQVWIEMRGEVTNDPRGQEALLLALAPYVAAASTQPEDKVDGVIALDGDFGPSRYVFLGRLVYKDTPHVIWPHIDGQTGTPGGRVLVRPAE